jgi:hypothetical protein
MFQVTRMFSAARFSVPLAAVLAALPVSGFAWGGCRHDTDHVSRAPMDGVTTVEVYARAGELEITGSADATELVASGRACVSDERMLPETGITLRREDDRLQVLVELPDTSDESGDRWRGEYAILNLEVEMPHGVELVVVDSSGDLRIRNVASLQLTDSSGDIDVRGVDGPVLVPSDSSGDIYFADIGDLVIQIDSSGDIEIHRAASVTIANDTSGEIEIVGVDGDVTIGNDSSGQISVENVGGSFSVQNDTSGGIRHRKVAGAVSLPPGND